MPSMARQRQDAFEPCVALSAFGMLELMTGFHGFHFFFCCLFWLLSTHLLPLSVVRLSASFQGVARCNRTARSVLPDFSFSRFISRRRQETGTVASKPRGGCSTSCMTPKYSCFVFIPLISFQQSSLFLLQSILPTA